MQQRSTRIGSSERKRRIRGVYSAEVECVECVADFHLVIKAGAWRRMI